MSDQKLIVVYRAAGELEAHAVKGRLESVGIPAMLQSEAASAFPFTVNGLGEFRILVPAGWEREALAVLAEPPGPPVEP